MEEILRLRFLDRDRAFTKVLTSIKSEMNARGMFHSCETVKRSHGALVKELEGSRGAILATMSENFHITMPSKIDLAVTENAINRLRDRKEFLERHYLGKMKVVISSLQNEKMLEPYLNLSNFIALNEHELRVGLAQEIEKYISSHGATLYERVENRFLNRPIVVVAVITVAVVTAILVLWDLIKNGS